MGCQPCKVRRWPLMRRALVCVTSVAAMAFAGCGHAAFRTDDRVHIATPAAESTARLPVTISWSAPDLPPGAAFGVFVDASVPPSGVSLRSHFADQDHKCKVVPTCPDAAYLAALDIYVTPGHSVVVSRVSHPGAKGSARIHRATIVMLDSGGRRIGEAAWSVAFTVATKAKG